MSTFIKAIGILLVSMCVLGSFLSDPEDEVKTNIKIAVMWDMEEVAKSNLKYSATYERSSFFLIKDKASLYYSGKNAFGVPTSLSLHADVESDLTDGSYTLTNLRSEE
jgi:hypothetical protein